MKRPLIISAALMILLDQISKIAVLWGLNLEARQEMDVIPGFIHFIFAKNYGINFGLFDWANRWVWIILALIVCGVVLHWVRKETNAKIQSGAGILIGGALGNVIDRVSYGYVVDFLNVTCCGIYNPFSFNVADIAIFTGAFMLILMMGKEDSDAGKNTG